jgi:hypothetical protein
MEYLSPIRSSLRNGAHLQEAVNYDDQVTCFTHIRKGMLDCSV